MAWEVEFTDEFERWWAGLDEAVQDGIDRSVHLLEARGPTLAFPHSSDIRGSSTGTCASCGSRWAAIPTGSSTPSTRGEAILLVGGNKVGDDQFYERMVPIADRTYDQHLEELSRERAAGGSEEK